MDLMLVQVNVLRCKGQADSKVRIAKAEAEAIRTISGALREFGVEATSYLVALRYLQTLQNIVAGAQSRTILFPFEMQLVGALNLISSSK